MLWGKAAGAWR